MSKIHYLSFGAAQEQLIKNEKFGLSIFHLVLLWNWNSNLMLLMNDENHQQTKPDVTHKMTIPTEYRELSAALEFDFSMKSVLQG